MEGDIITLQDLFVLEQQGVDEDGKLRTRFQSTGIRPKFMNKFEAAGISLPSEIFRINQ
jgi:pilus assembly protein CpaF